MGIRLDKYLWAIRAFKTRSQATEACKNGRIKVNGSPAKASREIAIGDKIELRQDQLNKSIQVKNIIKNRVNATLAAEQYTDLTPEEEYERIAFIKEMKMERRDRGAGRPSKKDRRNIDQLKGL